MQISGKEFRAGVVWNLGSFGVTAAAGLALNIIIGRFYGPGALGSFSLTLAVYIFASQFAVFGFHYSVLRHISENPDDTERCDAILTSALLLTGVTAAATVLLTLVFAGFSGFLFKCAGVERGLYLAAPGLWFFAVNKTLLASLNAKMSMRLFSAGQALRYILMAAGAVVFIAAGVGWDWLPLILSVAEFILFVYLGVCAVAVFKLSIPPKFGDWPGKHLAFGAKSFLSGAIIEFNSRIDVLMLGFFTGESQIGIYTAALMFAEGLSQIPLYLRNNVNPVIARLYSSGEHEELVRFVSKTAGRVRLAMLFLCLAAVLLYIPAVRILFGKSEFCAGWTPFIILAIGIFAASGLLPSSMLLIQTGRSGWQTIYMGAVLLTNILVNLAAIPFLGISGAALGAAAGFVCMALYLKIFTRKLTGVKI